MIRSVKVITASSYLAMFFLGVGISLVGAAARNIGLTPVEIGGLLTAQQLGFMVSVSIVGALADTYEKPRILAAGSLILAVSFFTFYLTDIFWVNLVIMLLIGVGIGSYEGATDAMLLDVHTTRQSLHINVNHFFVTLGSILITVYLIFLQMNWRTSVVQSGVAVLVLAGVFAFTKLERSTTQAVPIVERIRVLSRSRLVMVLFVATIVATGAEIGTTGILTTYLMELRDFTQVTSKVGLVVFLTGIAVGRLAVGFLTQQEDLVRHTVALFGLSSICFAGLFTLDLGPWTYLPIFVAGLSVSALLPLLITLAGLLHEDLAGTTIGAIKVAIPIGGMLLPFGVSLTSTYSSFETSLLLFPLAFLIAFGLLYVTVHRRTPMVSTEHQ